MFDLTNKTSAELSAYIDAIGQLAMVSITDLSGCITEVNQKFCEISGYSQKELIGQNHQILNSNHHPKPFFSDVWKTITHGNVWHKEICNRNKSGTLYWIDSTIVPLKDDKKDITSYLSVSIDITECKNKQTQLQERLKEQTCLYAIRRNMLPKSTTDETCKNIIDCLIPAMQFPEITSVKIELNGKQFTSKNYHQSLTHHLQSPIIVSGKTCGELLVFYHEEKSFLQPDEQNLLNTITDDLSGWLERKQPNIAIIETEQRFGAMFDAVPIGIALIDSITGEYRHVNTMFSDISGRSINELRDINFDNITQINEERIAQADMSLLNIHKTPDLKITKNIIRPDGTNVWINLSNVPIDLGDKDHSFHLCIVEDITETKESELLIWQQANFDALTNLANRYMFQDYLEREIKKSERSNSSIALLLFDLDHFKDINDLHGHAMGDLLLKETARRLSSCVRETDIVARLGGDEFTIILSELTDLHIIDNIAQDALQILSKPFKLTNDKTFHISASVGVACYPSDALNTDRLLKTADQAMYTAKARGRNCYVYYTPTMQHAALEKIQLADELHTALSADQFRVMYQPIVELTTGTIHKAEALIRWMHPTRGLVSPANFIPLAEETGNIIDIGEWVFHEVANQLAEWQAAYAPSLQISVNRSPIQFYNEDKNPNSWFNYLKSLGLPGKSVIIEITEGLLHDSNEMVTNQLLAFHEAGMQVSLDDFGTGYSSLSYLKKFDLDYIKINQSFTSNLAFDCHNLAFCEGIIIMAHKLGLKVIAEGVETIEQHNLLTAAGCDYAQGYMYSQPIPSDEFEQLLKENAVGNKMALFT
ncbi:MAG: EAL domain-containing protein [Nitrosomonas sp.]|nr:EAL domain-containing protein [Nitrosomonas sp.]